MSERPTDFELLRAFTRRGDQQAFAQLVRRHLDLVYATALRKVDDPVAAEEITQNVFVALARKAWQFARDASLPGWLYKTTLLEAREWWRGELRRRRREQTAAELGTTMKTLDEQTAFRALVPLLDEALLSLREKDRAALLLRFYENQSLREVGAALGVSEDTAQKRVATALDKVVHFFESRGFRTATVATAMAALQRTALSAPGFMAASVTQAAVHAAPAAGWLTSLLSRLATLSRLQKISTCVVVLSAPLLWCWHANRVTARAQISEPQTVQVESATTERRAQPRPQHRLPVAAILPPPAAPEPVIQRPAVNDRARRQKGYTVQLVGFIDTSDSKMVLLEIRYRSLERPNARPFVVRKVLAEGQTIDDTSLRDAPVHLEFLRAHFRDWSVRLRENGEETVLKLERWQTMPAGKWNLCLNTSFDAAVDLYAALLGRTVLCHPGVHRLRVFAAAVAADRAAAIRVFDKILQGKTGNATILDGDKFAVLAPLNLAGAVSKRLKTIPVPAASEELLPAGAISLENVPMEQALNIYGTLVGRKLITHHSWPSRLISFRNQTSLTKAEVIYAFNILFDWQNWKAEFVGRNSFRMIPSRRR